MYNACDCLLLLDILFLKKKEMVDFIVNHQKLFVIYFGDKLYLLSNTPKPMAIEVPPN